MQPDYYHPLVVYECLSHLWQFIVFAAGGVGSSFCVFTIKAFKTFPSKQNLSSSLICSKSCRVALLNEGISVPLMQCPLLVVEGIWNFCHGVDESSTAIHEGHYGIINVHQQMLAEGKPILTSIQGTAQPLLNHPACEPPG